MNSRYVQKGSILRLIPIVLVFCATLLAQGDLSTVRGTIADPTGALVPNVSVELINVETNVSRKATTSESGDFEIPYVPLGTYKLTATASGFKNAVADNIILRARETRRIDVVLELGSVGTEVTVAGGGAQLIATEGSQVANGFSTSAYVDSPLSQSYFPQAYMTTLPNIQTAQGGWTLRFAGQSQVVENLDGVTSDGSVNLVQNMNDFEDLQVVAVNNSAEYSRVAQFSMAGKAGTNKFHGKVYYDVINSALQARNYFSPKKVPYKEHRGGANINGPVIKDKLFFYFGYSLVRIPSSSFYNRNVPTLAMRSGDFSSYLTQATPVVLKDPLTGIPFPNNVIPANRINPVSQKTQDLYIPKPNQGLPNSTNQNYGFLFPHPTDLYRWDSHTDRLDWKISEKNTLFGRYINRVTPYILNGSFENLGTWTRQRRHHSIVANDTHVFSPTLVNSFNWGWIKDYFIDDETTGGFTPQTGDQAVAAIGLQGVNPKGYKAGGFPQMTFVGLQQLFQQPGGVNLDQNIFQFTDSMTWSTGKHVIKWGSDLRVFRDHNFGIPTGTYGTFNFNGSLSGIDYGDFLLGLPYNSTRLDPLTDRNQKAYEWGLFITDTFKVSRRLTLDYGLRWDYFAPSKYADGLQYNWDPASGNVIVPQEAKARISPLYSPRITIATGQVVPNASKKNFRPRIGAAYRLQEGFVIRGGYGQYTEAFSNFFRAQGTGPFQISESYFNTITNGVPFLSFPNPFPSSLASATIPSQSVAGYPLDTKHGVIHQFNVSLEKELGKWGVRASYIGSRSKGLNYGLGLNKPQPSLIPFSADRRPWSQFVGASYTYSDGEATYNSGQIEVQRKAGAFLFDGHYTIASNLNNMTNMENPYDHLWWGRDAYTSRHRVVLNATYDLPFGKGRRFLTSAPGVVNQLVGGWQLGFVSYFQSGQYFTPTFSGFDASNTNTSGGLPDRIADGNYSPGQRDRNKWFDPSAFVVPPKGRFGNSGANILEGPGMNLQHLSLIKDFPIRERLKFVIQGMFTNIANHPIFDFPFANISAPASVARTYQLREGGTGGREMAGPRNLQLRARFEF
ncbi:MAG TPA: TonB-dependent receptor [Bryobacteraceae bacterium]|nr:TonB-dependent receptor [Bryobacteraceae bacterium]